ncbi:peptide-methionine (S)-S-oxide reductase [Flavimarina sp. Hel_I_48]|uniref:peptide-methionine (S)-S-oxide reductase n=1 Tax=Flavimarina sp. Hel_I_48 TaxID=1392488 RepID=UPI0004DFC6FF|nr:peptide-methionine (S)-S-oxide reductase [Flavimarina sp. Hel_I_48]
MKGNIGKVGMGGGCHWCTEAVFNALKGVINVEQGYIASTNENDSFSEGVLVHYNLNEISLKDLIYVHLHTHASASAHSFRKKYRSAVYSYEKSEIEEVEKIIDELQKNFESTLITRALPFSEFEPSRMSLRQYYEKNKEAPFCQRYIVPKLDFINKNFKELERV